ncbi:MAG: hypothetical protein IPL75_17525 [Acidobacteria bacterium]|jgi:uncharacterized membrane protein|nr:hypothetical protein [Acidobacteriota bacterium]
MNRDPNRWAALSYALGLISGIIVLSMEKRDGYVRFHAWQSVLAFSVAAIVSLLLPTLPVVGDWRAVSVVFRLSVVALWVVLMMKALKGESYRLPYLGDIAASFSYNSKNGTV